MKKISVIYYATLLLLSACTQAEIDTTQINVSSPTFYTSFEDCPETVTKTYIDGQKKLCWTKDDRISIFVGNTLNQEYKYSGDTGAKNGSFSPLTSPGFIAADPLSANFAFYPYSAHNEIEPTGEMSVIFPSIQQYAIDSFGLGANSMVAVTESKEDMLLQFKNLCGYLIINLYGAEKVASIEFKGNDGEKISGNATVKAGFGIDPVTKMSDDASTSITLECSDGITIGATEESATEFWFCIPPVNFSKGFSIKVTNTDGYTMVKSVSGAKNIVRNTINLMSALKTECTGLPDIPSQAVDLGLSVMWGTCNVGASEPEGYGGYYAWGEIETKDFYDWTNYIWCNGTRKSITKYNTLSDYGIVDNIRILKPEDDVAHVSLQGKWRMPTIDEWEELASSSNCTWTHITQNGVKGFKITSKKEGFTKNSIFLPTAGNYELDYRNFGGYYWSSSLYSKDTPYDASFIFCSSSNSPTNHVSFKAVDRCVGFSVRPIYDVEIKVTGVSLSENELNLNVGDIYTLKATISPSDALTNELIWSSNNPSIVNVDSNGTISASKPGNGIITVKTIHGGHTASCSVTVHPIELEEMVDLGLSVKWASLNIGASGLGERGDYFAWGETETYYEEGYAMEVNQKHWKNGYSDYGYNWQNYKWSNGTSSLKKYNSSPDYGIVDNKTQLEYCDDVARVRLGGLWRMPTIDEFIELKNNCTWQWIRIYDTEGYKVTSNISGYTDKWIFIPVAGFRWEKDIREFSLFAAYWSSTIYGNWSGRGLYFNSNDIEIDGRERCFGQTIRPVYGNGIEVTGLNLDKAEIGLFSGESYTLKATITPDNATIKELVWSSSDERIASVNGSGKVTAKEIGNATITVKTINGDFSAHCSVHVSLPPTPEAIDLGLSVMWASHNVGATRPEDYGQYYAWGETETKDTYGWNTYKWCNGSYSTLTKYNTNSNCGSVDNKTILELEDDVAHSVFGSAWRMPTEEEFKELTDNCTSEWTTQNGVAGYRFTSKKNGHSIFLPAAGNSGYQEDPYGWYWSSTLNENSVLHPLILYFGSGFLGIGSSHDDRSMGQSVRPVYENGIKITGINLNYTDMSMLSGEVFTLTATISPDNATIKDVIWSSNNTAVATVDQNGNVTAVKDGNATITATTLNGHTASCAINVQSSGTPGAYEAIDLGLSVKWASFNVGATKPEEYGDYFAWGETDTKETYDWDTYKWCNGSYDSLTKYCTQSSYGSVDNKVVLQQEDDVAQTIWKDKWRMPTIEEFDELIKNCDAVWTKLNGIEGTKFTSMENGNCIFLPAAGNSGYPGHNGWYWTSSLFPNSPYVAYPILVTERFITYEELVGRYDGMTIRPVYVQ